VDRLRHLLALGPVPVPAVARVHLPVLYLLIRPVKDRVIQSPSAVPSVSPSSATSASPSIDPSFSPSEAPSVT
jgi:hypothetical protein